MSLFDVTWDTLLNWDNGDSNGIRGSYSNEKRKEVICLIFYRINLYYPIVPNFWLFSIFYNLREATRHDNIFWSINNEISEE